MDDNHDESLGAGLAGQPWTSLVIEDTPCLMKALFSSGGYSLLLCDTSHFWSEEMDAEGVRGRLAELNRRLGAPAERVCEHLREAFGSLPAPGSVDLRDNGTAAAAVTATANFSWKRRGASEPGEPVVGGAGATIALRSRMSGLPLRWEFRLRAASHSAVWRQLVAPSLGALRVLSREGAALRACIRRKDAEIADYRDGGATVSRKRLETKPFDDGAFRTEFYSKNLASCVDLSSEVVLDGDLQQLYSVVTSSQLQQRDAHKRKASTAEEDSGPESNSAADDAAEGPGEVTVAGDDAATQGVPPSQASSLTQKERRRVPHKSTPKKKAMGLFR